MTRTASLLAALLVASLVAAVPALGASTNIGSLGTAGQMPNVQCRSALQLRTDFTSPSYTVPHDGTLDSWSVRGGSQTSTVQLQVYRPVGPSAWRLVAESPERTVAAGAVKTFSARIPVQAGDILGRTGLGCVYTSAVSGDNVQTFGFHPAVGSIATPDGPGASAWRLNVTARITTAENQDDVGSTSPVGREDNDACNSSVQLSTAPGTPSYTVPADGRIVQWRFQGRTRPDGDEPRPADAALQVWRRAAGDAWTLIAETATQTAQPFVMSRYSASIMVRKGDRLGLRATTGCASFTGNPADSFGEWDLPVPIGATDAPDAVFESRRLNVAATLERCFRNGKQRNPRSCFKR